MTQTALSTELFEQIAGAAQDASCELVHAEFKGGTLRLIIDKESGISIDDCTTLSKAASTILDADDFGAGKYTLEVTSPGLDRELYRPQDYQRFVGRALRVTFNGEDGAKRTVTGRLTDLAPDQQTGGKAEVHETERGETLQIPLNRIQKAKLEIEL